MEQLEQEFVLSKRRDRRHIGMVEALVGFLDHRGEIAVGNGAVEERPRHMRRHLGIRQADHRPQFAVRQARPDRRHEQSAVAGQSGEQDLVELQRLGTPARALIGQGSCPLLGGGP